MKKSMWLYNFLTSLLKGVFKFLFFIKTTGLENENVDGPVIYCVNHISNWDPVIVACETKRPINFMSKKELFDIPILKNVLSLLGAFPIDRSGNDIATLKDTIAALKNGARICLFPQGTRCPDVEPSTTQLKGGAALLARHTKATIIPIGIYTKGYRIKVFKKIYVNVGNPITFEEMGFTGSRDDYDNVINKVFCEICKLCDKAKDAADGK